MAYTSLGAQTSMLGDQCWLQAGLRGATGSRTLLLWEQSCQLGSQPPQRVSPALPLLSQPGSVFALPRQAGLCGTVPSVCV